MTSTQAPKKLTFRRLATFLAAIGVLVMSSGVALMVSAGPASAANKVGICHATSSDSNPYVFISVDDDSAKLKGHLKHMNQPNKTWKNAGTFEGVPHAAGAPKRDFIGSFTDDQGVFHLYDGNITAASCDDDVEVPPKEAVADVEFTDPSCANLNEASHDATGANVSFEVTDGSDTPGVTIEVTATADEGSFFADQTTTMVFTHLYGPAFDLEGPPCVIVNPPGIASASVDFVDPSCANDNSASYKGTADNATFEVTDGSEAAGAGIEVTATADEGFTFANESTTKVFTHTFDAAEAPCTDVAPPVATPTVVHSGLVSTPDLRGEQGLALLVTGMVMLVLAGGLSLVRPTRKARS